MSRTLQTQTARHEGLVVNTFLSIKDFLLFTLFQLNIHTHTHTHSHITAAFSYRAKKKIIKISVASDSSAVKQIIIPTVGFQ